MAFHLLVVEDCTADWRLIRLGVERCRDCATTFVENADEAMAILRRRSADRAVHPDLLLLDLNLPGTSGHELLEVLASDEALKTIPVVVFSASPHPLDVKRARRGGARDYIVKPRNLDEFVDTIEHVVRSWMAPERAGSTT